MKIEINDDYVLADKIGANAVLEMMAEECVELAHACLKLSRKRREENPTPKGLDECIDDLNEEMADVIVCLDQLYKISEEQDKEYIAEIIEYKIDRMKGRMKHE